MSNSNEFMENVWFRPSVRQGEQQMLYFIIGDGGRLVVYFSKPPGHESAKIQIIVQKIQRFDRYHKRAGTKFSQF